MTSTIHRTFFAASILVLLLIAGCTSIQPITKIGLIAPFEGLYRETGYDSLYAVRLAIDECAPAMASVIPLALDDSGQPEIAERTARKLLEDRAVAAIVGPYSLASNLAVEETLSASERLWVSPLLVDEDGSLGQPASVVSWLAGYVAQVARLAELHGIEHLAVSGLPIDAYDFVDDVLTPQAEILPIRVTYVLPYASADLIEVDALLWLGQAHEASKLATAIAEADPQIELWLGLQSSYSVFTAHLPTAQTIYWVTWHDPQYNIQSQKRSPDEQLSNLTYYATCQVLRELYGDAIEPAPLTLSVIKLQTNGVPSANHP